MVLNISNSFFCYFQVTHYFTKLLTWGLIWSYNPWFVFSCDWQQCNSALNVFEVEKLLTGLLTLIHTSSWKTWANLPQDKLSIFWEQLLRFQWFFVEKQRLLMEVYIRQPAVCYCRAVIDGRRHAPFTGQAATSRNLHLLFQKPPQDASEKIGLFPRGGIW